MKKFLTTRYAPAIVVGVLIFLVIAGLGLRPGQDDQFALAKMQSFQSFGDLIDFLFDYYMSWGGRAIVCFVQMYLLTIGIWFWRVLSILLFVLMILSMVKLTLELVKDKTSGTKWYIIAYFFIMFFTTARPVLNDGIFWYTGSFHYAFTTSLLMFLLIPILRLFDGVDSKKIFLIAYVPATIYAANHEQSGAVLLTFALIANVYYYLKNHKIPKVGLTILIVAVAAYIFTIMAPGNFARLTHGDVPQQFFELSTFDKLLNGYNFTVLRHNFKVAYNLTILLAIMLSFLTFKNCKDKIIRAVSLLPILYLLLYLVLRIFGVEFANTFFIYNYGYYSYYDENYLMYGTVATLIGTVILLIFPYLLYIIYGKSIKTLKLILLFFAAIAVSWINFLSPDMELSGSRIYYTTDMIMLLISAILLYDVWQIVDRKNLFFRLAVFAVAIIGIVNYVSYVFKYTGIRAYFLGY